MGFVPSAELIYGVPLTPEYDAEDQSVTPLWDAENEDWVDLEALLARRGGAIDPWDQLPAEINVGSDSEFERWKSAHPEFVAAKDAWTEAKRKARSELVVELRHWGHHADPEGPRAILTFKGVQRWEADAWDPTEVKAARDALRASATTLAKAKWQLRELEIDINVSDARWYLLASYG